MAGQKETPEPLGAPGDCYEIRLQEDLDDHWESWFEGMELTKEPEGQTCLFGKLPDQGALLGVLRKIQEIGLTLLSVRRCRTPARD